MSTVTPTLSTQGLTAQGVGPESVAPEATHPPLALSYRRVGYDVVGPFLITRLVLLLVGWLTQLFPVSPNYPLQEVVARGWHFSPHRLLDIWGRWDSGWYLNLVRNGYMFDANVSQSQSNVAFAPLYPMLVRFLLWPFPSQWQTDGLFLLVAVIVSNLFFLSALILLYLLAQELTQTLGVAQRTILYLLFFPSAFFLSCAYTEATFLFFSVAALYAAQRRQWAWAGIAAALLGISRLHGVLIIPVLLWLYMDAARWRLRNVRASVLWLLAVPIPFLIFLAWLGQETGNWLAPFSSQLTFNRTYTWPWTTLLSPRNPNPFLTPLEQIFIVFFLILAVVALWRLGIAYGLWTLFLILPSVSTGTTYSSLRFLLVAAPAYIVMALWSKNLLVDRLFQTTFFALQIVLMVAWCQFYFVA